MKMCGRAAITVKVHFAQRGDVYETEIEWPAGVRPDECALTRALADLVAMRRRCYESDRSR